MSQHKPRYRILNPDPGAARFTSERNAHSLVERGHAVFEGLRAIRRLPASIVRTMQRFESQLDRDRQTAADVDREIGMNRRGVVYWNGNSGHGQVHLPGQVIS